MRNACILGTLLLIAGLAAGQDVRVVGAAGATIKDLVNTPTLVTVVLKEGGVADANLKITGIHPTHFTVMTKDNHEEQYRYEQVVEIKVQGGRVEQAKFQAPQGSVLGAEDQKIVERSRARIKEIYDGANDNQDLKIEAAMLLALGGDAEAKDYLQKLVDSNEIKTQFAAAFALYMITGEAPEKLLRSGLEHGNRNIRAQAATLAGLTGYRTGIPVLNSMLQDRASELSAPAARALARLGCRDIIPKLLESLGSLSEEKGNAAVFGLVQLGGDDIIEQLKLMLPKADGKERFRIVLALHKLGDPLGKKELIETFNNQPTLKPDAALLLAEVGDWNGQQYLRERLARRENPSDVNLIYRAKNVCALFEGGDTSSLSIFQDLLREGNLTVKKEVFELAAELGSRLVLTILQPSIESSDTQIALGACKAVICTAMPDYRKRYLEAKSQ